MQFNPDQIVYWENGPVHLNATIVYTWLVMAILTIGSWLVTRRLSDSTSMSRWQNLVEVLVDGVRRQIRDVARQEPGQYLPFVGTLFLFIAMSNLLVIIPSAIYQAPTASLSTTAALATCVFFAVPLYGIANRGLREYLRNYLRPSVFMLPFNIIGELSRTLALAVRLYGNMMSGTVIIAILIGFVPLFVPIVIQTLGLLTGMIQAYIFAILAMVYIASATQVYSDRQQQESQPVAARPVGEDRHESQENSTSPEGETS